MGEFLEDNIEQGELEGFIDMNIFEYRDKSLVVQKIVNISMDFNQLISQLGNKGVQLTNISCTQCGHACDLPDSGSVFICPACGTPIKVTDIFEKFKGIL